MRLIRRRLGCGRVRVAGGESAPESPPNSVVPVVTLIAAVSVVPLTTEASEDGLGVGSGRGAGPFEADDGVKYEIESTTCGDPAEEKAPQMAGVGGS